MNKKRDVPAVESDNDIAAFWDNNDFTDFADDTESAGDVVFEKLTKETISVRLEKNRFSSLRRTPYSMTLRTRIERVLSAPEKVCAHSLFLFYFSCVRRLFRVILL
ncbi:MAG: CopG family antitoxin [bacterium]